MIMHLLVVEPDQAIRDELRAGLRKHQFEMSVLYDTSSLIRRLEAEVPSAIVLRHGLPVIDGLTAIRSLREAGYDMPIVIISRSADVIDKVVAFECGANDYLVDPFDIYELVARIRNTLRFHCREQFNVPTYRKPYGFGDFELDFLGCRLFKNGTEVAIRPGELALLKIFATHPMKALTRARIMGMLGREMTPQAERGLDVQIFRLRAVLGRAPSGRQYVQTIRGQGYIFVPGNGLSNAIDYRDDDDVIAPGQGRRAFRFEDAVSHAT